MDLTTNYLGFKLKNPFVVGASPLVDNPETVRRLEDAGAAAIVLHSLFEEEIHRDIGLHLLVESYSDSFSEALSFLPELEGYHLGPARYLELIQRVKSQVDIPVIASLNGATPGGWTGYASQMQDAGADAIELNIYFVASDIHETGVDVEDRVLEIVNSVREAIRIPLAVKLSPYYSSFAHMAHRIADAGADGLVLFNRFYQPDIDTVDMTVVRDLKLSTSEELRLRLRWIALLSGRIRASLAATGGVHTIDDAVKVLLAGADSVQLVSALLQFGPGHLTILWKGLAHWLEEQDFDSLSEMQGSLRAGVSPDSAAYERANYIRVIDSWKGLE